MSIDLQLLDMAHVVLLRDAARLTAGALVAGLWQGILLCAVTGFIVKAIPKSTATVRFVVWAAVFCVSVAMPFVNLPVASFSERVGAATASHLTFDVRWSYLLAALWIGAAAYRLLELILQGLALKALWKSAAPANGEALMGLEVPLVAVGRRVELCTSDEVDRPSVIGFLKPRILIPTWLFAQLTAVELNHIVLHELEHLRRRDDWVNLLQKIGLVLLPLNPVLFWIDRRLCTERELACDDGVLERTKMPRAYATSLTSIAQRRLDARLSSRLGTLALAATGLKQKRSELSQRIESILVRRSPVNRAFSGVMAVLLLLGVVGSAALLAGAPQLISFGPVASKEQASAAIPVLNMSSPKSSIAPVINSSVPTPGLRNVSFHQPAKARVVRPVPAVQTPVRAISARHTSEARSVRPQRQQFVVLTSWEDAPVSRVVVQTPDGRFFLAPYAAVPTQAGWLLVQL